MTKVGRQSRQKIRVQVPNEISELFATHAHLGHIDVQPVDNPLGATSDLKECTFWVEKKGSKDNPSLFRLEGNSEATTTMERGKLFDHEVKLSWKGFIEMDGNRIKQLLLSGRGTEKLRWGPQGTAEAVKNGTFNPASTLVGGHPVKSASEVRYGIIGKPTPPAET